MSILWPRLPSRLRRNSATRSTEQRECTPLPTTLSNLCACRWSSGTEQRSTSSTTSQSCGGARFSGPTVDHKRIDLIEMLRHRTQRNGPQLAEAGNRDVWSFTALVALPHLTRWRFVTRNRERWLASDLTRHTWARLWWQVTVFEREPQRAVARVVSEYADYNRVSSTAAVLWDVRGSSDLPLEGRFQVGVAWRAWPGAVLEATRHTGNRPSRADSANTTARLRRFASASLDPESHHRRATVSWMWPICKQARASGALLDEPGEAS